ncbi:MAG: phosphoribosylformylglycinamidine synthase subunit PurS [Moorea sp. SIO1F2]|uniref:phosphoribosylformylglycinamidine synthase subunit PurS n=1 Tax=unclassified Moorena TaxID=2683338 RepID=UPI0013B8D5CC|nr:MULTISPECIES: phosphoribosylformylglycinamidine synthase subunit PurS [unclassified Moorena]NEO00281.1 phosphoribosylformylglycinamidine synthase subunit PurS [Moorena sp. SIO3I7]NEO07613.1 phosphoribosylformylglycinamidine synthase subunit PurS [Moorena sp. SIO3I8]NEO19125.1 phosphoribosylformylglycinamidine synthase subunit PurS [Moorena sp. SIO4A5]NEP20755.1 phosphoribosylformylglycinamidine synthase subunit PurS [Moorena sp. SIO3I6]NEQ57125.1 phosphoribosylformylglycinamidine synthase s
MINKYQAYIYVTLRNSVLDPAGVAVESGLKQLGYESVEQVRIGKYIELSLSAANEDMAQEQLNQICDQLLANPVIENYRFELVEMSAQLGVEA